METKAQKVIKSQMISKAQTFKNYPIIFLREGKRLI